MTTDILYSFRRCPYAIRVRWALLICELKVEIREIDLKNKPLDFLNKSKTKTVPILIKKNSEVIEESLEIILWALSESSKQNVKLIYFPDDKKEDIYALYQNSEHVSDRFKKSTLKYFDQFYTIINDPKKAKRSILEVCRAKHDHVY